MLDRRLWMYLGALALVGASMARLAHAQQREPDGASLEATPTAESGPTISIDLTNPALLFEQGGYLMWPILFCSIVAATAALERLISLRRGRVIPEKFVRELLQEISEGRVDREGVLRQCRENASPVSWVIRAAARRWGRPMTEIEQAINEGGQREVVVLRRNLRVLSGVANIATLLGLLGTVIGMILAFNEVATASGQPRAEMLASGIAQALLTTAFGLCVAIPALFLHGYFAGRLEKLVYLMDQAALLVAERISAESIAVRDRQLAAISGREPEIARRSEAARERRA